MNGSIRTPTPDRRGIDAVLQSPEQDPITIQGEGQEGIMSQTNTDRHANDTIGAASTAEEDVCFHQNLNRSKMTGHTDTPVKKQGSGQPEPALKAPDGGYGWFVVLGSFLVQFLIGGLGRSDGLFFLMFEASYNQSATLTAWPGAMADMLRLGMGPIASAICQRWSVRTCCMIGGLGLGLVQIVTAFSPSFSLVLVSNGALQGIARGLLYGPSLIIVTMYFDRRRSFATGISTSGVGVGTFLLVPLIQFLFDTYGFMGGFLVTGAICFHALVMAMLSRPLFLHYKFIGQHRFESQENDVCTLQDVDEDEGVCLELMEHKPAFNGKELPSSSTSQHARKTSFWKSTTDILFPREKRHKKLEGGNKEKPKLFHFSLLRDPAFLGYCLSLLMFTATFKTFFAFLPPLAKSSGLTSGQAVFILSISGAVDTVGRIAFGFLLDRSFLRRRRLAVFCCVLFLLALVCASMPVLAGNFGGLCVAASLFGTMAGTLAAQKSVICVDLLGAERMPSAFGILLLFQAVGLGIGPLLFVVKGSAIEAVVKGSAIEAVVKGSAMEQWSRGRPVRQWSRTRIPDSLGQGVGH
ncbi:hypothetical protein EGW08_013804 [Elysia chlorotica]|uniref:Major facilitator superfamily (MFS) profile domain-containing protein n=1 Tax=Elysia chlorotica TaxID=188477 RepID=A0A433TA82_ELYCH|nr:hypothetical protein EGW08_013804 [Elysia chlorotica]